MQYVKTTKQQLGHLLQILHRSLLALCAEFDEYRLPGGFGGVEFDAEGGINEPTQDANDSLLDIYESLEDTAVGLYDLITSSAVKGSRQRQEEDDTEEEDWEMEAPNSYASAYRHGMQDLTQIRRLQSLIQKPFNGRIVVNALLSKWTNLSKRDIHMMSPATQTESDTNGSAPSGSSSSPISGELGHPSDIRLIDVRGRKYRVPWDVAKTWVGMEGFLYQVFCRTAFWPRVLNEQFDLVGNGIVLMPQVYDRLIKPGSFLIMRMWALEPTPSAPPPPARGPGNAMAQRPPGAPMPSHPPARGRTRRAGNSNGPVYVGN
ncbi:hypothetical protein PG993_008505 [Apiospora rasikravindrae]|uniref:Ubiquitin-like domain-containing protein n=1 Tax=Apiospora rasikravindrae TaxID=990691 RepID=A0ABR1T0J8_9PEZI